MGKAKQINLKPHFGAGGKLIAWEITEGENIVLNRGLKAAEKAWAISIRRYQKAGFSVEARAYDRQGSLVAHGIYKPNGTVEDLGPKKKPAAKAKAECPAAAKAAAKSAAKPRTPRKPRAPKAAAPAAAPAGKGKSKGGKGSRKPSAYNLHVAKRMPQLRAQGHSAKDAMKIAAQEWSGGKGASKPTGKGKSKVGKAKGKAAPMPTGKGKSKSGKARKPSAYNVFMATRLPQLRQQGYAPKDAMKIAAEEYSRQG